MGVLDFIGKGKDGMDCEKQEDGTFHCRKFKAGKGGKFATGSEATIAVDQSTCKALFVGRYSVLEEDEKDFEKIAKKIESGCKGGIQ
ncbi:MAG: hypothetical protein QW727_03965 [Candidatus Pacearchaeota archaeon]